MAREASLGHDRRPSSHPANHARHSSRLWALAALALCFVALAWRLYRLARDPFWLDEIYSFQVVQQGLRGILANSAHDPHPPLYYLVLWLTTGFASTRSVWLWRFSSVLFGTLTVPVVFALCRRTAGGWAALLASLWLAVLPTHLYYSQETRWPAFATLLAALSLWLLLGIQARPLVRWRWWAFAAVTVVGVFSAYSYLMIAGVQVLYLGWTWRRERAGLLLVLVLAGALLLSALIALHTLPAVAAQHAADSAPLSAQFALNFLLVAEISRYGYYWATSWVARLLGVLAVAGLVHMLWKRPSLARTYAFVQVAAPLAIFRLVLVPLLKIRLPVWEARQFLVLLPAICLLLAHGLALLRERLSGWLAWVAVAGIFGVVLANSAISTESYWQNTKSPEGQAALYLRGRWQPADALVSLHFATNAALSFYLPQATVFSHPVMTGDGWLFAQDLSILAGHTALHDQRLSAIRQHARIWILLDPAYAGADVAQAVRAGCRAQAPAVFLEFQVQLLTGCPPP